MSQDEVGGRSIKEWSLIIVLVSLAIVFSIIAVGFILAIMANPTAITFSGSFDLSQFNGILIGIAMVAVTLVAQQLTAKQQQAAVHATDETWLATDPTVKKTP